MPGAPPAETFRTLPTPLNPFVGREREVEQVCALLRRSNVRLLTLTGPGGVGKTRLAVEVARLMVDAFPDGVAFVGLAPITDPDLVATAVAQVLGVRETGDAPLADRLAAFLQDKRVLLVLDNVEQVVEAAPLVADLLAACPELRVLATSRVRLCLSGEREHAVPPLALADHAGGVTLDAVAGSEAVRLFAERAQAVREDFALTPENAPAVVAICRRLDGLPLAIELAAARTKVFPPPSLLGRMERSLPLLTGGPRDAPERQQTMRDAIAWSDDLLTPEQQAVFRRLAVFVGGLTLEAAEAVAGGEEVAGIDVVDGVSSLVDQSLLRQEPGPGGEPRYAMLETVREFGLERLATTGEEAATRRAHAAYFLALAERAGEVLWAGHDPPTVERLEAEHPNLRAALAWFEGTRQGQDMLRLAAGVGFFWYLAGHHREGRGWVDRALAAAPEADAPARLRALTWAGLLAAGLGEGDAAVGHLERAAALARRLGLPEDEATAVILLGTVLEDRGAYDAARALFARSLTLYPHPSEDVTALKAVYHLGVVAYGKGEVDRARRLWEEAMATARALGDPVVPVWCLQYLGLVATEQGDLDRAAATLGECVAGERPILHRHHRGPLLATLAVLGSACGAAEAATRLLGAAEAAEGRPFDLPERVAYDRAGERLRAALGTDAFERLRGVGREQAAEAVDADARAVLGTAAVATPPAPSQPDAVHGLTPRELEVLRLLVEGRSDREIGAALFISHRTVMRHVTSILAKLGVDNRTAATNYAVRHGLV